MTEEQSLRYLQDKYEDLVSQRQTLMKMFMGTGFAQSALELIDVEIVKTIIEKSEISCLKKAVDQKKSKE